MTEAHAEYAPSSMYLTVACPGWKKQASLLPPDLPTEATQEGEAGHAVAEIAADATHPPGVYELIGTNAANGVEITEDMVDGAKLWVEALEGYPAKLERRVDIKRVHMTKCWGTPDARQINRERKIARVADYKFGHEYVDEFENWQLLAYLIGLLDEWEIYNDPEYVLEMTVVQPRYYNAAPIRTWTIKLPEIWPYLERMQAAVREAEGDNPRVISGTHCTHCPARVNCSTFAKTVMHAVDFAGRADPMVSTADQIGRELKLVKEFIKRLEARETGLATMAEGMIRNGQRVPFFSLEQSEGRLAWTVPVEVVQMCAQMVGKSALKPPALITPTQAKDRRVLDTRVIAEYSARPKGALKLVADKGATARKFKA